LENILLKGDGGRCIQGPHQLTKTRSVLIALKEEKAVAIAEHHAKTTKKVSWSLDARASARVVAASRAHPGAPRPL
jgi:hypothetical protein